MTSILAQENFLKSGNDQLTQKKKFSEKKVSALGQF